GEIVRLVTPRADALRSEVASNPPRRAVYSPSRVSLLGRAIRRALSRAGVLDVLTCYKRNRMRILGTGVEYSCAGQVWHSGIDAAYRGTAGSPERRRIFRQLPRACQGTSHFGDDVVPGSDLAHELAAREFKFLSADRGRVLVFDGGHTLHRGALVETGERLALQVGFINVNDRKIRTQIA